MASVLKFNRDGNAYFINVEAAQKNRFKQGNHNFFYSGRPKV
jgi:hypothetical protein